MTPFTSYDQVHQWILSVGCNATLVKGFYNPNGTPGPLPRVPGPLTDSTGTVTFTTSTAASTSVAPSYSTTNIQVAGVDELDRVKTDGTYLYTVTNNTVAIVLAYPASEARLLARVTVNGTIQGILIVGNKLAIVTQSYSYYPYPVLMGGGVSVGIVQPKPIVGGVADMPVFWGGSVTTSLWVFDVSNHSSPNMTTSLTVNGTLAGARLIGNYAYLVATQPVYCNGPIILPENMLNNHVMQIPALDIYHSDVADYGHSFTSVVGIDISQSNPTPSSRIFLLGTSSTIYVSLHQIYLTQPVWNRYEQTAVHRISIDGANISYEATGTIAGHVLNQFSMDEYNGYFRVATNDFGYAQIGLLGSQPTYVQPVQHTNVYVLDRSLHVVGKLEGLSPGEAFYAARFSGDRAYLVTFQRVDPLFVIGLQDPTRPRVLGQLVIPGVSDYLQPYDENHLIGFGKSSINMTWENAALFQGLKLSLFDVTDPSSPKDTSDFLAGDRGSDSPALTDHTSILFDRSLNLLVIPVEIAQIQSATSNQWAYGTMVFQGAYVFSVTVQNGIVLRGSITHLPAGELPNWNNSSLFVKRSLYIGNVLYTVSDNKVMMNNLSDLSGLGSVSLA